MRALREISEAPSLNVLKAELCLGNTRPSNDREHVFPAASRKVVSSDTSFFNNSLPSSSRLNTVTVIAGMLRVDELTQSCASSAITTEVAAEM